MIRVPHPNPRTQAFPNPFARIKTLIGQDQGAAREAMNWLSYYAVDDLQWCVVGKYMYTVDGSEGRFLTCVCVEGANILLSQP